MALLNTQPFAVSPGPSCNDKTEFAEMGGGLFFFPLIKKVTLLLKVKVVVRQMNYLCPSEDMRKGLHIQPKQGLIPLLVHLNAVFFWLIFVGPA